MLGVDFSPGSAKRTPPGQSAGESSSRKRHPVSQDRLRSFACSGAVALSRGGPTSSVSSAGIRGNASPVSPTVQILENCISLGYRRDVERHRQRSTLFRWGWQESPRTDRFISPKEQPLRESGSFTTLLRSLHTMTSGAARSLPVRVVNCGGASPHRQANGDVVSGPYVQADCGQRVRFRWEGREGA